MDIRFISKQCELSNSTYKSSTNIQEVFDYVSKLDIVAIDSESSGLDQFTKTEYCFQIGDESIQYVIDMLTFNYSDVKGLLEHEDKLYILQNAVHDLQWFYKHNIVIKGKIWDTYLAEIRLTNGLDVKRDLESIEKRYLNTNYTDKSEKKPIHNIPRTGYSELTLRYCAYDIMVLPLIYRKQLESSETNGLRRLIELECKAVKAVAYTSYCGVYADSLKLINEANKFNKLAANSKEFLVKKILKSGKSEYLDTQLSLFDSEPRVAVNFDDTEKMQGVLKEIGGLEYSDYSNTSENSELAFTLRSDTKASIIVNEYNSYLKNKRKANLCKKLLGSINKKTGRIHTCFHQINATGRLSSGNRKNPNHPNIMGVDKDIKHCFTGMNDNVLTSCDYDNMEYYIYADVTDNKQMQFELKSNADGHSEVARFLFDKKLQNLTDHVVRAEYSEYRDAAKRIRFTILNGGDNKAINKAFGCGYQQAKAIYDRYKERFSIDDKLVSKLTLDAIFNGKIDTDNRFGGVYYLKDSEKIKNYIYKYGLLGNKFWDKYRDEKATNSDWYNELKPIVHEYQTYKSEIKLKVINYLIQGIGSNIFKIALIYLFDDIISQCKFNEVLIVNLINDEIVIETHKDISEYWKSRLIEHMEKAALIYCSKLPLTVSDK